MFSGYMALARIGFVGVAMLAFVAIAPTGSFAAQAPDDIGPAYAAEQPAPSIGTLVTPQEMGIATAPAPDYARIEPLGVYTGKVIAKKIPSFDALGQEAQQYTMPGTTSDKIAKRLVAPLEA